MKKTKTLFVVAVVASSLLAASLVEAGQIRKNLPQITNPPLIPPETILKSLWPQDGLPVIATDKYEVSPNLISDDAGGAIIVWESEGDLYAKRVDAFGYPVWGDSPARQPFVPISTAEHQQIMPQIVGDGYGGAIIVWEDYRNSDLKGEIDIYAQRISADGEVLWEQDGIPICDSTGSQFYPKIVGNDGGGAIIAWVDERIKGAKGGGGGGGGLDLYISRIDPNGEPVWGKNGMLLESNIRVIWDSDPFQLLYENGSGAIIVWEEERDGIGDDFVDIYAQRVNHRGYLLWGANGTPITTAPHAQELPQLASDGDSGAIVVWQDHRDELDTFLNIYAQRINKDGYLKWENDIAVSAKTDNQERPRIVSDNQGGAIISWIDYRNRSTNNADIYAQRIGADGSLLWRPSAPFEGISVCTVSDAQDFHTMIADGSGGATIVWQDGRNKRPAFNDIYAQRLNPDGTSRWGQNGAPISMAIYDQIEPKVVNTTADGSIIVWADYRDFFTTNLTDVYGQYIKEGF